MPFSKPIGAVTISGTVPVSGSVGLAAGTQVGLAAGAQVGVAGGVDVSGSSVGLAAGAAVGVNTPVQSVFKSVQLMSMQLGSGIGINIDNVNQYASIVVVANPVGGSGMVIQMDWSQVTPYNALTGANATEFLTSIDSIACSFIIPVAAASLFITNANPNTNLQVAVYGTNRPVTNTQIYGGNYQPRRFKSNSAVLTAGQTAGVAANDGGPLSTGFNRSMYFQFSPVNVSCQLYMSYMQMNGSTNNIQVVPTTASGVTVTGVLPHPVGLVGYTLLPTTSSTTATVTLNIMQNIIS